MVIAGSKGPIPIVVGVSGHRDIVEKQIPAIMEVLREQFSDIRKKYPHSPIWLLSPLAEGADRIVAEAFLKEANAEDRLVVPLPMEQREYETDFASPDSLNQFRDLIGRSHLAFIVDREPSDIGPLIGATRDNLYRRVGAYIALHSHVFFALWDGKEPGKTGGTADIVNLRLNGPHSALGPKRSPLDPPDSGCLRHIPVTRGKADPPNADKIAGKVLSPGGAATSYDPKRIPEDAVLSRIDRFNQDVVEADLIAAATKPSAIPTRLERISTIYDTADALAQLLQARRGHDLLVMVVIMVSAAASLEFYSEFWLTGLLIGIYVAGFGILGLLRKLSESRKTRYIDYRGLAEALRIQRAWAQSNCPVSVAEAYMRGQRDELEWIRQAIRTTEIGPSSKLQADDPLVGIRLAMTSWVTDQRNYFARTDGKPSAAVKQDQKAHKTERFVRLGFIVGLGSALSLLGLHLFLLNDGRTVDEFGELPFHIFVVLTSLSLIGMSVAENYQAGMAYSEHAKRYRKMGIYFTAAEKALQDILQPNRVVAVHQAADDARKILEELGREALTESGDWVIMHRERDVDIKLG